MAAGGGGLVSSSSPWKYRFGLLLILAVVIIWVTSAEVTQLIFEKYRHPFLLTWLGASLLVLYLPIAYIKEWITPCVDRLSSSSLHKDKQHRSTENLQRRNSGGSSTPTAAAGKSRDVAPALVNQLHHSSSSKAATTAPNKPVGMREVELGSASVGRGGARERVRSPREGDDVEKLGLLSGSESEGGSHRTITSPVAAAAAVVTEMLTTHEVIKCALILAPLWLLTEYLSNAALSMTSVASTTILSSTSGLFTLLFGVTMGSDSLSTPKIVAALVSIGGVVMTELGKSTAADDSAVFGDSDRNPGETAGSYGLPGRNVVGDICGLTSAVSYGFYTTLLRMYVGGEDGGEEKADLQKVFGYIGLVTLLGLWWIVFPLHWVGWEPPLRLPSSYGLDEDILANGLIGSVISDYFWALSVVWTTPLVATLGLSLTIPLAMVADMFMHQRSYSLVYMLGSAGVFLGFIIANLGDRWSSQSSQPPSGHIGLEDLDESEGVISDKEID